MPSPRTEALQADSTERFRATRTLGRGSVLESLPQIGSESTREKFTAKDRKRKKQVGSERGISSVGDPKGLVKLPRTNQHFLITRSDQPRWLPRRDGYDAFRGSWTRSSYLTHAPRLKAEEPRVGERIDGLRQLHLLGKRPGDETRRGVGAALDGDGSDRAGRAADELVVAV